MRAIGGSRTKISALQGGGFAVYLSILCIVSARRETRGRKQRLTLVIDSLCKFLRAQKFAFLSSRLSVRTAIGTGLGNGPLGSFRA